MAVAVAVRCVDAPAGGRITSRFPELNTACPAVDASTETDCRLA